MDNATLTFVGTLSSVVATLAALAALAFAYLTVRQGTQARREAVEAQRREREAADAAHAEYIAELRRLQEATAAQHRDEIAERRAAAEVEIRVVRVRALGEVAAALVELIARANHETLNPPPLSGPFRRTLLPTILLRVKAAIAAYNALGGPPLKFANELATSVHMASDSPDQWISKGVTALDELERTAREHPALRLRSPGE